MDAGLLIFGLYLMIAHELLCGLMQYKRQADKPHKRLTRRSGARVCYGTWRAKKCGRIIRKA